MTRNLFRGTVAAVSLLAAGHAFAAASVVHVTLSSHDSAGEMRMAVDQATVAAGAVTFEVRNESGVLEHEMVVARVGSHDARLPYDATKAEVPEGDAQALGEVPELKPGATGKVTLDLTPGEYVLFCNVAGHYIAGMETPLVVK